MQRTVLVGTSGYLYDFWGPSTRTASDGQKFEVNNFYPMSDKKKWLSHYASKFRSVEINCGRYQKITPKMCQSWAQQAPAGFKFTIKMSNFITHQKKLNDFAFRWSEFAPCIKSLGNKLGVLLFQFPPMFKYTSDNLTKLENVKQVVPADIKCAVELRAPEWFSPEAIKSARMQALFTNNWTQAILILPEIRHLNERKAGEEKEATFGKMPGGINVGVINSKFAYLRFHGTTGYSMGTYGAEYMLQILELIERINPTYLCAYFNNTDSWTMLPKRNLEGDYHRVPLRIPILPSAVYDASLLEELLR